ncbi:MAG: LptF/LptG family permease [Candidatus Omnitrophica bacterium]|nr:LptF/LptG family permease [Candidatus Omnitrophota bacterium]
MKILRNYILEEFLTNFITILIVLTFMLLLGNLFSKMFDLVINRGVDILRILQIFVYLTPFIFVFTIPMAASVAALLTFGRMSADSELVALRASGVSLARIVRPILWVAVILSLFSFYLNDQIASRCHFMMRRVSSEISLRSPTALLEEGVFIKSFQDIVLFIHRIEENKLKQIRIYQPQKNGPTRTIIAEEGELIPLPEQNVIKLKLSNGASDEPDANDPGRFYKLRFGTYYLPLDISNLKFREPMEKKRKELTLRELWTQFNRLKNEGFIDPYALTEIHKKIAMGFAAFCLVFISIPLAIRVHRSEKTVGFAIALILGTFYWALLIGASSAAQTRALPPIVALHFPNLAFFLTGLWLHKRVLGR